MKNPVYEQIQAGKVKARLRMLQHAQRVSGNVSQTCRLKGKAPTLMSVDDFEAIFFDDRVGEDFFGNALELLLGLVAVPAIEIQDEEFSLADIFHGDVPKARKSVLDGLSLGIEDGAFWHHPNVCFHAVSITLPL